MTNMTATIARSPVASYCVTTALALALVSTVIGAVSAAGGKAIGFVDDSVPQIVKINGP